MVDLVRQHLELAVFSRERLRVPQISQQTSTGSSDAYRDLNLQQNLNLNDVVCSVSAAMKLLAADIGRS